MDGHQPAQDPIALDLNAESAKLVSLAQQANEALRTVQQASAEMQNERASLAQALGQATERLSEINHLLTEAQNLKTDANSAVQSAKDKASDLEAKVAEQQKALEQALSDGAQKIQAKVTELETATADVRARADQSVAEIGQNAQSKMTELTAAVQKAAEQQQAVTASANATAEQAARVKQLLTETETAKNDVLGHHKVTAEAMASKEKFEQDAASKLLSYETALAENKKEQVAFREFATKSKEEIEHLTSEADAMLFGATNAGLASAFKNEVKDLERQLLWASILFVVGILGLFGALYWLFEFMSQLARGHQLTAIDLGLGVLIRTAIVVPAVWFCFFFSRRAHALFELRQHYVHKASLAASVEPFRRQAGEHASTAVAGVLREIMKNPATILRRHRKMGDAPDDGSDEVLRQVRRMMLNNSPAEGGS